MLPCKCLRQHLQVCACQGFEQRTIAFLLVWKVDEDKMHYIVSRRDTCSCIFNNNSQCTFFVIPCFHKHEHIFCNFFVTEAFEECPVDTAGPQHIFFILCYLQRQFSFLNPIDIILCLFSSHYQTCFRSAEIAHQIEACNYIPFRTYAGVNK